MYKHRIIFIAVAALFAMILIGSCVSCVKQAGNTVSTYSPPNNGGGTTTVIHQRDSGPGFLEGMLFNQAINGNNSRDRYEEDRLRRERDYYRNQSRQEPRVITTDRVPPTNSTTATKTEVAPPAPKVERGGFGGAPSTPPPVTNRGFGGGTGFGGGDTSKPAVVPPAPTTTRSFGGGGGFGGGTTKPVAPVAPAPTTTRSFGGGGGFGGGSKPATTSPSTTTSRSFGGSSSSSTRSFTPSSSSRR